MRMTTRDRLRSERSLARARAHAALPAVALLVLALASSCAKKLDVTASELNGRTESPRAQLSFRTVRSLLEDSRGHWWFGSWDQGVGRFDGQKLTYFTKSDGLSDNQVRSIREDRNGVVWFEGGVGLSGFDGKRIIVPTHRNLDSKHDWHLGADDLWFKEDGSSGATEAEGQPGVYRYDGKAFTFQAYPFPADTLTGSDYATTGMARGKSGRVWFATYNAVFGYDGKTFTVIDDKSLGLDDSTGWLHVRCVFEDSKGRLWIGNNGIGVILVEGRTVTRFTQEMGLGKVGPHGGRRIPQPGDVTDGSPTLHRVFAIGEDRTGHIWFGTVEHGAWRYDGKTLKHYSEADGLTSKDVMCIYTDRRGDLWLAGSGVFKFNGTSFDRMY